MEIYDNSITKTISVQNLISFRFEDQKITEKDAEHTRLSLCFGMQMRWDLRHAHFLRR